MMDYDERTKQFEIIASKTLQVKIKLTASNNDDMDFPFANLSVWAVRDLMEQAYQLGMKENK